MWVTCTKLPSGIYFWEKEQKTEEKSSQHILADGISWSLSLSVFLNVLITWKITITA